MARWQNPGIPLRACGARPSEGGPTGGHGPCGGKPGDDAKDRFSRRDALCASAWQGRTHAEACHDNPRAGERAGDLTGTTYWQNPGIPLRACGARPSETWSPLGYRPHGRRPEMTPRAVLSEGRALRVRIARQYSCRGITWS